MAHFAAHVLTTICRHPGFQSPIAKCQQLLAGTWSRLAAGLRHTYQLRLLPGYIKLRDEKMLLAVRVRSDMNPRFWPCSRGRAGERSISHALQFRMPWTGQFVALTHRNQEARLHTIAKILQSVFNHKSVTSTKSPSSKTSAFRRLTGAMTSIKSAG